MRRVLGRQAQGLSRAVSRSVQRARTRPGARRRGVVDRGPAVKAVGRQLFCALTALLVLVGCSSGAEQTNSSAPPPGGWVDDDVIFEADGLTIHGTYHHVQDGPKGPAALLISESGNTDRNGDNAVAGPVGNMRQLAELLSDKGIASLRYDKIGTGKTGLGPYAQRPMDVVSAVYTSGAKAAVNFLAEQSATDK